MERHGGGTAPVEILRRETVARLAKEQNKPDPLANENQRRKNCLCVMNAFSNIQETDLEDVAETLLSAVALTYDPHTDYMGARQVDRFKISMGTELTGIGALLGSEDDGSTKITGIVVGGPADKSGELKLNDRIVAIDSNNTGEMVDILFMKLDKVVDMIRGSENSQIRLKVEPADAPGQAKIITLTRSKVPLKDELAKAEIIELTGAPEGREPHWRAEPSLLFTQTWKAETAAVPRMSKNPGTDEQGKCGWPGN
ncbi:MAG: PDZ domain-containing protein [Akkermansia sp.]